LPVPGFVIGTESNPEMVLLHPSGPLTVVTRGEFRQRLRTCMHSGARHIVVDLNSVSDLDAAGVAVLLVYARSLKPLGGSLRIVNATDDCSRLLTRIGVSHLLEPLRDNVLSHAAVPTDQKWQSDDGCTTTGPGRTLSAS
jgi:anti-anti-sigma factor